MLRRALAYIREIKAEIHDRRSLPRDISRERHVGHPDDLYREDDDHTLPDLEDPDDEEPEDD